MGNASCTSVGSASGARGSNTSLAVTTQEKADVGLVGLAAMGQDLVLNMVDRGFRAAVFNRTTATMEEFVAKALASGHARHLVPARSLEELARAVAAPKRIVRKGILPPLSRIHEAMSLMGEPERIKVIIDNRG